MKFLQKNQDLLKINPGRIKNVIDGIEDFDVVNVKQLNARASSSQNDVDDSQTITGTTMTLANTPTFVYGIYMNGQRLVKTADYSISGVTITFTFTASADSMVAVYKY